MQRRFHLSCAHPKFPTTARAWSEPTTRSQKQQQPASTIVTSCLLRPLLLVAMEVEEEFKVVEEGAEEGADAELEAEDAEEEDRKGWWAQ